MLMEQISFNSFFVPWQSTVARIMRRENRMVGQLEMYVMRRW